MSESFSPTYESNQPLWVSLGGRRLNSVLLEQGSRLPPTHLILYPINIYMSILVA